VETDRQEDTQTHFNSKYQPYATTKSSAGDKPQIRQIRQRRTTADRLKLLTTQRQVVNVQETSSQTTRTTADRLKLLTTQRQVVNVQETSSQTTRTTADRLRLLTTQRQVVNVKLTKTESIYKTHKTLPSNQPTKHASKTICIIIYCDRNDTK